ncbi:MAG: VacJ family lipoprotein [Rhodoferax sp.]
MSWRLSLAALALSLGACASGPTADPRDPLEPFNRGVYRFIDALDRAIVAPVATGYRDAVPQPVRTGVRNFFNNIQDAWSALNAALQLKGEVAGNNLFRFGVNTVFGLGGLLDIASEMRIPRQTEDFGQTLGHWGVGSGPYLVLPLLGPSTLRDGAALGVDACGDLSLGSAEVGKRSTSTVLQLVDKRANLLGATGMLDRVALDPYTFVRDAHLQRRLNAVYDGDPPDPAPEAYDTSDEQNVTPAAPAKTKP